MSKAPLTRQGSGAPSFCWHCNRQLQRAPGKGLGLFYFHLVRDAAGVQHRVHGGCVEGSVADGNKLVPQREKHWADDIPMGDVFGVCSVLQGSKK